MWQCTSAHVKRCSLRRGQKFGNIQQQAPLSLHGNTGPPLHFPEKDRGEKRKELVVKQTKTHAAATLLTLAARHQPHHKPPHAHTHAYAYAHMHMHTHTRIHKQAYFQITPYTTRKCVFQYDTRSTEI